MSQFAGMTSESEVEVVQQGDGDAGEDGSRGGRGDVTASEGEEGDGEVNTTTTEDTIRPGTIDLVRCGYKCKERLHEGRWGWESKLFYCALLMQSLYAGIL